MQVLTAWSQTLALAVALVGCSAEEVRQNRLEPRLLLEHLPEGCARASSCFDFRSFSLSVLTASQRKYLKRNHLTPCDNLRLCLWSRIVHWVHSITVRVLAEKLKREKGRKRRTSDDEGRRRAQMIKAVLLKQLRALLRQDK